MIATPPPAQNHPAAPSRRLGRPALVVTILFTVIFGGLLAGGFLGAVPSKTDPGATPSPLRTAATRPVDPAGTPRPDATPSRRAVAVVATPPARHAVTAAATTHRTESAPTATRAAVVAGPTRPAEQASPTDTPVPDEPLSPMEATEDDYPPAPAFTLPDLAGTPVRLEAFRGHPVWINFWATWCPPCQVEMPEMQKIYARYRDQGLVILGIDEGEDRDRVATFVNNGVRFEWTFLLDADAQVALRYEAGGLPVHAFVDRAGRLRGYQIGQMSPAAMEEMLRRILPPLIPAKTS